MFWKFFIVSKAISVQKQKIGQVYIHDKTNNEKTYFQFLPFLMILSYYRLVYCIYFIKYTENFLDRNLGKNRSKVKNR